LEFPFSEGGCGMKLKIGLVQMATLLGRAEENRRRFQELLAGVAGEADLVVFPETWNLGFYPDNVSRLAAGEGNGPEPSWQSWPAGTG